MLRTVMGLMASMGMPTAVAIIGIAAFGWDAIHWLMAIIWASGPRADASTRAPRLSGAELRSLNTADCCARVHSLRGHSRRFLSPFQPLIPGVCEVLRLRIEIPLEIAHRLSAVPQQ
jgi:hypothetical protein